MKILKNLLLTLLAIISWAVIAVSRIITPVLVGKPSEAFPYIVLLCLSLWYFNWIFEKMLLPLGSLPKPERMGLIYDIRFHLQPSLIYLTITGLGRFCCIIYILYIFVSPTPKINDIEDIRSYFIFYGLFFMVLGTVWEARTLINILLQEHKKGQTAKGQKAHICK